MTSDAKIGLLLGLVFIFIIAFIINGLPSLSNDRNTGSNILTIESVTPRNDSIGIGTRQRRVINQQVAIKKERHAILIAPKPDNQTRFEAPLPKTTVAVKKQALEHKTVAIVPVKPVSPKFYTVAQGDNLANIAKKFYGQEQGNRQINITRIFKANRRHLKSQDDIYIGQKLVIPVLRTSLRASATNIDKLSRNFPTALRKVESIGGKRLCPGKKYAVRQGDSLWEIAADQLGNGSRWKEIVKLNTGTINDKDNIVVGMVLRIPIR